MSACAAPAPATVEFDAALVGRYDSRGPRYTSYPTADRFHPGFTSADYGEALARRRADPQRPPLSLYVHLPFCNTVCFYCACNKVVTGDRARAAAYLPVLAREIALQAARCAPDDRVRQMHWGGGTPTFYDGAQLAALMACLRQNFRFEADAEISIEVDPRGLEAARVEALATLGFNRLSLGVQDFDPAVQRAINRVQSVAETRAVIDAARASGFRGINVDLIYGLPRQHLAGFVATLEIVIATAPDRISLYNYAHLPHLFKPQQRIAAAELPGASAKLEILGASIARLQEAGYVYIGMDHFARADDELAIAQREGSLQRNFQGYSTHADCDMLALGVTAIGRIGNTYSQNARTLDEYYALVGAGELPVCRGYACTADDLLRREIIQTLMCRFELDFAALPATLASAPLQYFAAESAELAALAADGLLSFNGRRLCVTRRGRLLIRNICMVFDRHLREAGARKAYSRVI